MKAKLFLCCLLTAISLNCIPTLTALAATDQTTPVRRNYARADVRNVYFCENKDLNTALFAIPYTYCVQILSSDEDWYYVRYAEDAGIYRALYGYCKKDGLTLVDVPPANVYLNMPVTVTFKPDDNTSSLPVLGELNVTAAFYGTYYSGASAYSYVSYDNAFGYISGANDDYPLNEVPEGNKPDSSPVKEKSGVNAKIVTALVLSALAVAAIVILYFTGRRKFVRMDK